MARNVTDNIYIKWEEKEQWRYVFLAMDNKENVEIFRSEVDCHMSETKYDQQNDTKKYRINELLHGSNKFSDKL